MLDADEDVEIYLITSDFEQARELFNESTVHGIINIPRDFAKKILRFETASVAVYADAAYMILYKQVETAATYSIGTLSAGIEIQRRMAKGEQLETAFINRDPLPIVAQPLYNPRGGYATYVMPAVLLLILQQTLLLGIGLLGGTIKEKGHDNFLASIAKKKAGALAVVLGKSIAYFSIYSVNALYVFVIVFRIFKLPMHASYFDLFVFLTPYFFSVVFLGLTIASFFKKREHALMVLLFTSIPFIFLSGFSWPGQAMPLWQHWFSQIIPSTPAINGFLALSQRSALFSDVANYWWQIWLLLFLFLFTATLSMKRVLMELHTYQKQ
jgi:ABC-2 type transport system permease protein